MKYDVEMAYLQHKTVSVHAANEAEAIRIAKDVVKNRFANSRAAVAVSVREAGTDTVRVLA